MTTYAIGTYLRFWTTILRRTPAGPGPREFGRVVGYDIRKDDAWQSAEPRLLVECGNWTYRVFPDEVIESASGNLPDLLASEPAP